MFALRFVAQMVTGVVSPFRHPGVKFAGVWLFAVSFGYSVFAIG